MDDLDDFAPTCHCFSGVRPHRFAAWEREEREALVYDETYGERLRLLKALAGGQPPGLIVTSIKLAPAGAQSGKSSPVRRGEFAVATRFRSTS